MRNGVHPKEETVNPGVGVSLWLSVLPIRALGLLLSRHEFIDALHLRYGLYHLISGLPSHCSCKAHPLMSVEHALSCNKGGWIGARHDAVRDILTEDIAALGVSTQKETILHPLAPGEVLQYRTGNTDPNARSDIFVLEGLHSEFHSSHIDICGVNRIAPSYIRLSLSSVLKVAEQRKVREYRDRVRAVEHADFIPFVFSSAGHLGPAAQNLLKLIARSLASKRDEPVSQVLCLMRARLSYTILRGALRCVRGPRTDPVPSRNHWVLSAAFMKYLTRLGDMN